MFQNPIGVLTTAAGVPVDIRDVNFINSNLLTNSYFFDLFTHLVGERVPQRIINAKGLAARGYFEVTNDVSKYTKADVFNGVGKKTALQSRFSITDQEKGGTDLARALRGFAMKFFTKDGILDLLTFQVPVVFTKQPVDLVMTFHSLFIRNPKTALIDYEQQWDLITLKPWLLHVILWIYSDFGIPDGYRKMDVYAGHTYELNNIKGERYYARFNFRTEQGVAFLSSSEAATIQARDLDYFVRDLYNAITEKNYPSWRLEMDVMSLHDIKHADYDPFDMTRLWKNGTYSTVPIGRVILNEMPENQFRDGEHIAFNPANLVPGIPGPVDILFQARRFAYKDAHNYRVGRNHDNIEVNRPKHAKTYNRDSVAPIRSNMKDAPTYYPNSFSGPIPYVDESKPKEQLVLVQNNAVDLQHPADFYNKILNSDAQKQRLADNLVHTLQQVKSPLILKRSLKLLYFTDIDLGKRVQTAYNLAGSCRA